MWKSGEGGVQVEMEEGGTGVGEVGRGGVVKDKG